MKTSIPQFAAAKISDEDFQDTIVTPNATERTIDQLLEEEFLINPDFLYLFASVCFGGKIAKSAIARATYRSARQQYTGQDESDLIVLIEQDNTTYALMIENKINAPKQNLQPQRYIQRGKNGIRGQLWDTFETCLIAPQNYLNSNMDKDLYHQYISYEKIISFLEDTILNRARAAFRIEKFAAAINKKEQHVPAPDIPEVIEFIKNIKSESTKRLPHLELTTGRANAKVGWFHFRQKLYPDGISIIIKMDAVVVEFKLPKCKKYVEHNEKLFQQHDYEFLMAGKSCSIRKSINPINCLLSLDSQKENILQAFDYVAEFNIFLTHNIF